MHKRKSYFYPLGQKQVLSFISTEIIYRSALLIVKIYAFVSSRKKYRGPETGLMPGSKENNKLYHVSNHISSICISYKLKYISCNHITYTIITRNSQHLELFNFSLGEKYACCKKKKGGNTSFGVSLLIFKEI